jgi:hypothetical protein
MLKGCMKSMTSPREAGSEGNHAVFNPFSWKVT